MTPTLSRKGRGSTLPLNLRIKLNSSSSSLGNLVKAAFELGKGLQRLRIGKWQELHEDDAGDVLARIDPEIGVGKAGPGEAAGATARRRSLGVDHEAEPPFLDHTREEFGVERAVGQDALQHDDVDV